MKPLTTTFASSALAAGGYALGTLGLGPIGFGAAVAPAILGAAGAALPPLWNLMSALPPKPLLKYFPGISLMFNISTEDMKSVTMPPWQKALRLGIVTSAALAASAPDYKSDLVGNDESPLILFVDNGWASAQGWDARAMQVDAMIRTAEKSDRPVVLIPAAQPPDAKSESGYYTLTNADFAQTLLPTITAQSWPVNYSAHIEPLQALKSELTQAGHAQPSVFWLSDGLAPNNPDFMNALLSLGDVHIVEADISSGPHLLSLEKSPSNTLVINVARPSIETAYTLDLQALNNLGQPVLQTQILFEEGQNTAQATFEIPSKIRASLTRVVVQGEDSAGATLLLDENWTERTVGVIDTGLSEALLDGSNFVAQAIRYSSIMQRGVVENIVSEDTSVITWTDEAVMSDAERAQLKEWVNNGGTLIRFAGPNLAAQPEDDLTPVTLRRGVRSTSTTFGGNTGGGLSAFPPTSPLIELNAPESLQVKNFILAEPDPELASRTWASLEDGTPLITARPEGDGQIILIHTSANTEWSNLPLNGTFFLQMMNTLVNSGQSAANDNGLKHDMPPLLALNATGELERAPRDTSALTQDIFDAKGMGEHNPPGYYGNYKTRMAYNVADAVTALEPLGDMPDGVSSSAYEGTREEADYASWLLLLAAAGMMADMGLRTRRTGASVASGASARKPKSADDITLPGLDN